MDLAREVRKLDNKFNMKFYTPRILMKEFPNDWKRRVNRLFRFDWSRVFETIQKQPKTTFMFLDGLHLHVGDFPEFKGKRYWII